ncbi:MAG: 28S ribosomal protein S5, mitochondrial [Pleopsidium flavum]|nr:MAG: 28S ribosomal protein S5, mitochondrial [Pleopsidium flavum]KAI9874218.1 MAG: 28S ribosomal protein S5, mitochondrial [Pleopsidium flavum]
MSVSRPIRCLFSRTSTASKPALRRHFHSSPCHSAKGRVKAPNIKASDMGMIKKSPTETYKPYSADDKAALAKKYTQAQLAAIEAGEAAIDPEDLATQATIREDPFALQYLDDLSAIVPVIDKPVRAPESNYDPNLRFKTDNEIAEDLAHWVQNLPDNPDRVEWMKFLDETRLTVGKEEAELNPRSSLAPDIPKFTDPSIRYKSAGEDGEGENDPHLQRLMKQSGFNYKQIRRFRIKNLVSHRVVNQTRMGKIQSMYYLTVAGNGNGLLGVGEGKASEPEDARRQAHMAAIRNMQPISRYESRTIYGEVEGKVGAVELKLSARPPGFGVRSQGNIFEMCRCAGITDMAARVTRSRNPMNVIKATFQALRSQRLPEDIARARGKKLVDVRKVYYGGNV